jgi:hypothetical protein
LSTFSVQSVRFFLDPSALKSVVRNKMLFSNRHFYAFSNKRTRVSYPLPLLYGLYARDVENCEWPLSGFYSLNIFPLFHSFFTTYIEETEERPEMTEGNCFYRCRSTMYNTMTFPTYSKSAKVSAERSLLQQVR